MSNAIAQATLEQVLCMDNDEVIDIEAIQPIAVFKTIQNPTKKHAYRIRSNGFVLSQFARAIYPVSSPNYPIRLFNRKSLKFNDAPMDDAAEGCVETPILNDYVRHDTSHALHEVVNKINNDTTRVVKYKKINPSIMRGVVLSTIVDRRAFM